MRSSASFSCDEKNVQPIESAQIQLISLGRSSAKPFQKKYLEGGYHQFVHLAGKRCRVMRSHVYENVTFCLLHVSPVLCSIPSFHEFIPHRLVYSGNSS